MILWWSSSKCMLIVWVHCISRSWPSDLLFIIWATAIKFELLLQFCNPILMMTLFDLCHDIVTYFLNIGGTAIKFELLLQFCIPILMMTLLYLCHFLVTLSYYLSYNYEMLVFVLLETIFPNWRYVYVSFFLMDQSESGERSRALWGLLFKT